MLNCVYYLQLLLFFCYLPSGVFRRKATVRWPPLSPDHENFLRRLYMKRCVFCRFPARIAKLNNVWWSFYNMRLKSPCEIASDMMLWFSAFPNFRKNGRICSFHWTFRSKVFQLQGGFATAGKCFMRKFIFSDTQTVLLLSIQSCASDSADFVRHFMRAMYFL